MRTFTLLLVTLSCIPVSAIAQSSTPLTTSRHTFELAHCVLKDGTACAGWFIGTTHDSLLLQIGGVSKRLARGDLLRVALDVKPERAKSALAGVLIGIYAGNALFRRAEQQPTLFLDDDDFQLGMFLSSAAFGLVGGLAGSLISSAQRDALIFDFSGPEQENASIWEELRETSSAKDRRGMFHLSFQASWVEGPVSRSAGDRGYSGGSDVMSLNQLRKVQLTYSATRYFDIGLSKMWLGQPSFDYSTPGPMYKYGSVTLDGWGCYIVGVVNVGWRGIQWDLGVGVGVAKVDFQAFSRRYSYPEQSEERVDLRKSVFSAVVNTELKLFVTDYLSIGLAADLVYVPEDVPAVEGVNFRSKSLGTRSAGFVLGIHL